MGKVTSRIEREKTFQRQGISALHPGRAKPRQLPKLCLPECRRPGCIALHDGHGTEDRSKSGPSHDLQIN